MRSILAYSKTADEEYHDSYVQLAVEIRKLGGRLYVSTDPDTFLGHSTFSDASEVTEKGFHRVGHPVKAEIIFNKSVDLRTQDDTWLLNHPILQDLSEKHNTVKFFSEQSPLTFQVNSKDELVEKLSEMPGGNVVLKPLRGFGGQGVFVGKKMDMPDSMDFPLLLQEFVDTSGGIPGLAEGHHDFRLIYFGDVLSDAFIRHPRNGKLVANVSQGGSMWQVPLEKIPKEVKEFCFSIDSHLSEFTDRVYCIDIGYHERRAWKLFELNAPPGLTLADEGDVAKSSRLLAQHLMSCVRPVNPRVL